MAEVATAAEMLNAMEMEEEINASLPAVQIGNLRRLTENLSGARKAAILCASLDGDAVSEVFRYLEEDEVQLISRELASLHQIPSETVNGVLREFEHLLTVRNFAITGGMDYAKRLINKAYGPETA